MRDRLAHGTARLLRAIRMRITEDRVRAGELARRLGDPRLALAGHQQLLDDRESRLAAAVRALLRTRHADLARVQHRLALVHPQAVLAREQSAMARLSDRLVAIGQRLTEKRRAALSSATARLDALSPLKVLARGYAIAVTPDGRAVRAAADVKPGDTLSVRVQSARIEAEVTRVEEVS
jgi:exodeoxyribonuclease VII large subunit